MNSKTNTKILFGTSLALALALAVWSPASAQPDDTADGAKLTQARMTEHCKEMKEQRQRMNEDAKTQDGLLTTQLAEMNRAPQAAKLDLLAGLFTRTVEQRIAMDTRRTNLEEEMMQHMMQHMQAGKDSMPHCPMMKAAAEKAAGTGKDQHDTK